MTVADGDTVAGRDFGNRRAAVGGGGRSRGSSTRTRTTTGPATPASPPWRPDGLPRPQPERDPGRRRAGDDDRRRRPLQLHARPGHLRRPRGRPGRLRPDRARQHGLPRDRHPGLPASGLDFGNFRPPPRARRRSPARVRRRRRRRGPRRRRGGLLNWTVYLDPDDDGVLDAGERGTVGRAGGYSFLVDPGTYTVREVVQPGYGQTAPASGSHAVTVAAGEDASGGDFGNRALGRRRAASRGRSSSTPTATAFRDASEPGQAGWTLFLDANFNGALDPGEPTT